MTAKACDFCDNPSDFAASNRISHFYGGRFVYICKEVHGKEFDNIYKEILRQRTEDAHKMRLRRQILSH